MMLTPDQQRVFHVILQNPTGLHVLTGTPGSGKTFFVKYLAQHFQIQNKLVLLSATIGAAALRFSSNASTAHTLFRIPSRGYLSPLPEPSTVLERLHSADVIVIDEMSMMTSYMLCTVEHRLKQACKDTISNTFCNKLVLLVGDLAQLPTICVHSPKAPDIICRCCHISSAPCWASAEHHKLQISVRHATDPTYLQFLNIIRDREPTESEIEATLSTCFVNKLELVFELVVVMASSSSSFSSSDLCRGNIHFIYPKFRLLATCIQKSSSLCAGEVAD
jgi:hypothetical protein